jgi:hypothetical protein
MKRQHHRYHLFQRNRLILVRLDLRHPHRHHHQQNYWQMLGTILQHHHHNLDSPFQFLLRLELDTRFRHRNRHYCR